MGTYLADSIEQDEGIQFVEADYGDLDILHRRIEIAADRLGTVPDAIHLPRKGFLMHDLTDRQRYVINNLLAPAYAAQNVQERDNLLKVPVEECGERMVSLRRVLANQDVDVSYTESRFHEACGAYANGQRIEFVRQQVASKLVSLFLTFNSIDIRPHLEDFYRPPAVQSGLLLRRVANLARQFPEWNAETVYNVATSLTAPMPGLAGHQAGAALDMTLRNAQTKRPLPIGNKYTEHGIIGSLDCPYVTLEEYINRMTFALISRMGGFRLLRTENWHLSSGDRGMGIDGPLDIHKAIYGPIKGFDADTGIIHPYPREELMTPYLHLADARTLTDYARVSDGHDDHALTILEAVHKLLEDKKKQ